MKEERQQRKLEVRDDEADGPVEEKQEDLDAESPPTLSEWLQDNYQVIIGLLIFSIALFLAGLILVGNLFLRTETGTPSKDQAKTE